MRIMNIKTPRQTTTVALALAGVLLQVPLAVPSARAQTFTLLHSFCHKGGICPDGQNPWGTPVMDGKGNLYSTTANGGVWGFGTFFRVTQAGEEKVLYDFSEGDLGGAVPYTGLLKAKDSFYGVTWQGGEFDDGVVFQMTP
jgi:uncharacterized repeat protein (TIGR03803 family)